MRVCLNKMHAIKRSRNVNFCLVIFLQKVHYGNRGEKSKFTVRT